MPQEVPGVKFFVAKEPSKSGFSLEEVRPVFRPLRQLRDELGLRELFMGMTNDFEMAIQEGATSVRIGRALFGLRPQPQR